MKLVHRRHFPIDHYVLVDDRRDVSPTRLIAEARRRAGPLALASTGNSESFTLIHNGGGIARRHDPHVHILCPTTRARKGMIYLVIALKNMLPSWSP